MIKYNNPTGLHPFVAAMLTYNDYDYTDDPTIISTTSLMKPVNMVALERFNNGCDKEVDVEGLIPSVMGSAMHSLLEVALQTTDKPTWEMLGVKADKLEIQQEVRKAVKVNGTDFTLSGKFDVLYKYGDNPWRLADLKTMSTWGTVLSSKEKNLEFTKQLSIYRWLNQDKEIDDIAEIFFWYTDWSKVKARQDKQYPQSRVGHFEIALWSIEETERFIRTRLHEISLALDSLKNTGRTGVACRPEDLWQSEASWKYYKPNKQGKLNYNRATKVFSQQSEAIAFMANNGNVGEVKEFPAMIKRCNYCSVRDFCEQYPMFKSQGLIPEL